MQSEDNILEEQEVRLTDVTEEGAPPLVAKPKRHRKKLVMAGVLCALLLLTVLGGYLLLRAKQIQVKTSSKTSERVTSGSDLQKAAFDSLSQTLSGLASQTSPPLTSTSDAKGVVGAATDSTRQAEPSPNVPMPTQPGTSMTVAPPAEAMLPRGSQSNETIATTRELDQRGGRNDRATVDAAIKPKTDASILFSAPLAPASAWKKPPEARTAMTDGQRPRISTSERPVLDRTERRPAFGAMLPVRLMGVLYTLRQGALARLELMHDVSNERFRLKRGTIFVGSLQGAELDRAYVEIKGYIDPETKVFTPLQGELLGSDGGAGLRGKQRRIAPVWVKILDRAAQAGTQILTSALGRGNSSVIVAADPYGTIRPSSESQTSRTFVEVSAGTFGFVLITTLPASNRADAHLTSSAPPKNDPTEEMSDAELAEMFAQSDAAQIRVALPRMNPALRPIAEAALRDMEAANRAKER